MTDVAVDLPTRIMHRTVEEILNPGQRLAANPAKGHRVNISCDFRVFGGQRTILQDDSEGSVFVSKPLPAESAATMCFSGNGLHVPTEWPEERYRWSFREPPGDDKPARSSNLQALGLGTFHFFSFDTFKSLLMSVIWVIRWFPRTKSTSADPSPK